MTIAHEAAAKIEAAKKLEEVQHVNIWKDRRAYLNLTACEKRFAGNRTHQLYIDMQTGAVVDQIGKGVTSREFDEQRAIVVAALA
jgi:hypothetical protein